MNNEIESMGFDNTSNQPTYNNNYMYDNQQYNNGYSMYEQRQNFNENYMHIIEGENSSDIANYHNRNMNYNQDNYNYDNYNYDNYNYDNYNYNNYNYDNCNYNNYNQENYINDRYEQECNNQDNNTVLLNDNYEVNNIVEENAFISSKKDRNIEVEEKNEIILNKDNDIENLQQSREIINDDQINKNEHSYTNNNYNINNLYQDGCLNNNLNEFNINTNEINISTEKFSNMNDNEEKYKETNKDNIDLESDDNIFNARKKLNLNKVNDIVGELAPMELRKKAYFYDKMIISIPLVVLFIIYLLPSIYEVLKDMFIYQSSIINLTNLFGKVIGYWIIYKIIYCIYYVVIPFILKGQTFGKKKYNLRIVSTDVDNVELGIEELFKREMLCKIKESILFIGYLRSYKNVNLIARHDITSNTRVIIERAINYKDITYDDNVADIIEREE